MANTTDQNSDALISGALAPKLVSSRAGRVEAQPIADQIEAIKFAAGQRAKKLPRLGIMARKFIPPGMISGASTDTSDTGDVGF
jgi:hypothetical protein